MNAVTVFCRLYKAFENTILLFRINVDARVSNAKFNACWSMLRDETQCQLDLNSPHIFDGVFQQIGQDGEKLVLLA